MDIDKWKWDMIPPDEETKRLADRFLALAIDAMKREGFTSDVVGEAFTMGLLRWYAIHAYNMKVGQGKFAKYFLDKMNHEWKGLIEKIHKELG